MKVFRVPNIFVSNQTLSADAFNENMIYVYEQAKRQINERFTYSILNGSESHLTPITSFSKFFPSGTRYYNFGHAVTIERIIVHAAYESSVPVEMTLLRSGDADFATSINTPGSHDIILPAGFMSLPASSDNTVLRTVVYNQPLFAPLLPTSVYFLGFSNNPTNLTAFQVEIHIKHCKFDYSLPALRAPYQFTSADMLDATLVNTELTALTTSCNNINAGRLLNYEYYDLVGGVARLPKSNVTSKFFIDAAVMIVLDGTNDSGDPSVFSFALKNAAGTDIVATSLTFGASSAQSLFQRISLEHLMAGTGLDQDQDYTLALTQTGGNSVGDILNVVLRVRQ